VGLPEKKVCSYWQQAGLWIICTCSFCFRRPAASLKQQKFKGGTSVWLGPQFSWQDGYGAFSVSPSQVPVVKAYVLNQEEHHRTRSFEEEFISLLKNCGIQYDPKYVFG
jgi:hypothetical protein